MEINYVADPNINFLGKETEYVHAPDDQELWQESFVLYLFDAERNVYSFLRIAQTPNYKGGTAQIMLNIWTPEGFYKHTNDEYPFDGSGRSEKKLTIGDNLVSYEYNGDFNWTINDPEYNVKANLTMQCYHPGINYFPSDDKDFVQRTLPNHTQATGWITGDISVAGKQYNIAGYGWRDHSWGYRKWLNIRAHRFFPAIIDKDFYFTNNVAFIGSEGVLNQYGVLVRGNRMIFVQDFDIVAYMGVDGVSNCGGKVTLRAEGETFVFEYEPIAKSSVIMSHGLPLVEGMCRVKCGDRTGVGLTETTTNPQGGKERPYIFPSSTGIIENGWHTAVKT